MAGIYIHIPFCKQACNYCDFHFSVNTSIRAEFITALISEIELRKEYADNEIIESIYFGGGTPSLLNEKEIASILDKIYLNFNTSESCEITLECNPDDLTDDKLKSLLKLGINRLSIGLQSFNNVELKWMNRAHTEKDSRECVINAQYVGFKNISIDLIYGSKFQTFKTWENALQIATSLNVQHISAYNLTIENKTKLGLQYQKGIEPKIDEGLSSHQFLMLVNALESNEFIQYEISNFGKEGLFSKHNSNYWLGAKYIGFGPSAHSFNGIQRQWNIANNSKYISLMNAHGEHFEIETLTNQNKYNEYVLTRLRTIWGCDTEEINSKFGGEAAEHFLNVSKKFKDKLSWSKSTATLNKEGKLIADYLASEFFVLVS